MGRFRAEGDLLFDVKSKIYYKDKKLSAKDNVLLFDLKDLEKEFIGGNGEVSQTCSVDRSAYISSGTDQLL